MNPSVDGKCPPFASSADPLAKYFKGPPKRGFPLILLGSYLIFFLVHPLHPHLALKGGVFKAG